MKKNEEIELSNSLIKNNIDKIPSSHLDSLVNNGKHWNYKKIPILFILMYDNKKFN